MVTLVKLLHSNGDHSGLWAEDKPTYLGKGLRAKLDGFTIDELCRYLVSLGQNVHIAVESSDASGAHLRVVG